MLCVKRSLALLILALAGLRVMDCHALSNVWLPGFRYEVVAKYGFESTNVEVRPSDNFSWNGTYKANRVSFEPMIEFTTESITNIGKNSYAHRVYHKAVNNFVGASEDDWEWQSDAKDISLWESMSEKIRRGWSDVYGSAMSDLCNVTGKRCEPFAIFEEGGSLGFESANDKLLLAWMPEKLLSDEHSSIDVSIIGMSQNCYRSGRRVDNSIIGDVIRSEVRVLFSSVFGDIGVRDREKWDMDAALLNGLLCGKIHDSVRIGGVLTIRRSTIERPKQLKKFSTPFSGRKLVVEDTSNAYIEVSGRRWKFTAGQSSQSSIELWYDGRFQVLRFASIRIKIPNYDGDVPNPKLGKMTKEFKGRLKGDFTFTCEYVCNISKEGINE